jgi:predicted transcriptional regulator
LGTGELLGGTLAIQREQTKHNWGATFVTIFQQALEATDELSGEEARVFLHLLRSLGANNEWKFLKPGEMAVKLGMSQSQISRALRGLSEKKILLRGDRIGRTYAYSMNPHLGWKGFFGKHTAAKAQAPALVVA